MRGSKHNKKKDAGKLMYDLLPFQSLDEVVKTLNQGYEKYGLDNWLHNSSPEDVRRYEAAMLRHYSEFRQGRTHDSESGLHHFSHIAANSLFIIALLKKYGEFDGTN